MTFICSMSPRETEAYKIILTLKAYFFMLLYLIFQIKYLDIVDQITQIFFFHVLVKHSLYQRPKIRLRGRWDVVASGMELAHVHCPVVLLHMEK